MKAQIFLLRRHWRVVMLLDKYKKQKNKVKITMFYVALDDVTQNINRVAMRVKNGGHDIPTEDILRRSKTSFDQLYRYAHIVDTLVMIDNSLDDGKIILEINNGF